MTNVSGSLGPEKLLDLAERFHSTWPKQFFKSFLARSSSPEPRGERGDLCLLSDDGFSKASLRNVAARGSVCQHVLAVFVFVRIYRVLGRSR